MDCHFRIKHCLTRVTRVCGGCGKPVGDKPWSVHMNRASLCTACARRLAPELSEIVALVAQQPADAQRFYGVRRSAETTRGGDHLCPETGERFQPRAFELCHAAGGSLIGPRAGEDLAPALAAGLHKFYSTTPAPRPVPPPPPPPPPTAEELAAARRTKALASIAAALDVSEDRAEKVAAALAELV